MVNYFLAMLDDLWATTTVILLIGCLLGIGYIIYLDRDNWP